MMQDLYLGADVARDWLAIQPPHRGARRIDNAPSALKAFAATCAREGAWIVFSQRPRRRAAARASAASRATADARGPVSIRSRWYDAEARGGIRSLIAVPDRRIARADARGRSRTGCR